jgi:hypothetical protein
MHFKSTGQERVTNMKKKTTVKSMKGNRRASFDKVNALDTKKRGHWVTIKGQHKFIEDKK